MKQSKCDTDASHLTFITNETISKEAGDYYPVFHNALLCSFSQWKHYETLYGTQTKRDDLSFVSMIDLLFCFFTIYAWKQADFFSLKTLNEQISVVFLSFPSKTNTAKSLQQEAVLLLPTCAATTNTK